MNNQKEFNYKKLVLNLKEILSLNNKKNQLKTLQAYKKMVNTPYLQTHNFFQHFLLIEYQVLPYQKNSKIIYNGVSNNQELLLIHLLRKKKNIKN